jgi:CRP-like cAMP-binding protein
MSLGGRTVTMSSPKKDAAHEELLSILRTAKNRLEYLTQNDWVLIVDRAKRTSFKKGNVLIQAGKQNKMVYWLVKGNARVETASKAFIAQLEAGEVCGEMAFLENGVASASVTAADALEVCAIEWSALTDLFELYPHMGSRFYRSLAVNLSRRMRDLLGARQGAKASN